MATMWWFKSYGFYKNGITPNGAGWLSQTNKYVEMMTYIGNEITKKENENGESKRIRDNPQSEG